MNDFGNCLACGHLYCTCPTSTTEFDVMKARKDGLCINCGSNKVTHLLSDSGEYIGKECGNCKSIIKNK